jgi:hypothetical protein
MAVRPHCPENLAAGQPSTSHRPISQFTPTDCGETSRIAELPLGNLSLKGIELKRPQSKGIADLGPLGEELEQLEKPPNQGRFKGVLGAKSPAKEAQGLHT